MGLDAFVRCRCFEEGKLRQPPEPFTLDDIYIDEDGYLASRMLDDACQQLGFDAYWKQYEQLDRLFTTWSDHPCEHDDGEYCSEWVSNIAGKARFRELVDELGGEDRYPILSHLLPDANGGSFPASQAQVALDELDDFIQRVVSIEMWGLMRAGDDEPVWTGTSSSVFPWMMSPPRGDWHGKRRDLFRSAWLFPHLDAPLYANTVRKTAFEWLAASDHHLFGSRCNVRDMGLHWREPSKRNMRISRHPLQGSLPARRPLRNGRANPQSPRGVLGNGESYSVVLNELISTACLEDFTLYPRMPFRSWNTVPQSSGERPRPLRQF